MTGKTISHYKIFEKLGEGGMGIVYLAEDTKLKREVAIKFLPRSIATNTEDRERFKIEAQAAAALNHPNISHIYAIEETDDEIFIVMEYIEGKELKQVIEEAQGIRPKAQDSSPAEDGQLPIANSQLVADNRLLTTDYCVDVAIQIASGLQAAHEKGVVHRDIKSSNIMLTDEGRVKIMDFGLAKIRGTVQLTKEHSTLGTTAYMSPEQTRGESVDHRTDIWSLGVVLYEMLTGNMPFKGDYEQAVIYSILNEEINLLPDLPQEISIICQKSLAKNPDERYGKVDQLIGDLKNNINKGSGYQPVSSKLSLESAKGNESTTGYISDISNRPEISFSISKIINIPTKSFSYIDVVIFVVIFCIASISVLPFIFGDISESNSYFEIFKERLSDQELTFIIISTIILAFIMVYILANKSLKIIFKDIKHKDQMLEYLLPQIGFKFHKKVNNNIIFKPSLYNIIVWNSRKINAFFNGNDLIITGNFMFLNKFKKLLKVHENKI